MSEDMQDGIPSFLRLLEGSPELPIFCFHDAVQGPAHKCASSRHTGSEGQEEMGEVGSPRPAQRDPLDCPRPAQRDPLDCPRPAQQDTLDCPCPAQQDTLDCSGVRDIPNTCTDLKCCLLSSTPLRKVYSPYNLTLDSDTDSGWSMCMATPTCLQPVKRTPLSSTRDDDSPMCTVLDSGAKGEPVGLEAGPSNSSGEKVQNTVSWRPKEKPVARALFCKPSPLSQADSDSSFPLPLTPTLPRHTTPAQRLQARFEQCVFSPIAQSPLVLQRSTPLASTSAADTSLLCSSVVAETPPSSRQGCGVGRLGGGDTREESVVSCSQELFASPETLGAIAGDPETLGTRDPETLGTTAGDPETLGATAGDPEPRSAETQQLAKQEQHVPEMNSPHDQVIDLKPRPPAEVRVVECTPPREPSMAADSSMHHNQSDVFDMLFMSGSQLEAHLHSSVVVHETPPGAPSGEPSETGSSGTALDTAGGGGQQHPQNEDDCSTRPQDSSQDNCCSVCPQKGCLQSTTGSVPVSNMASPPSSICNPLAEMPDNRQSTAVGGLPTSSAAVSALELTSVQVVSTPDTRTPLQEPQRPPDPSPSSKRRKLAGKTFLYPGSRQLRRGKRRAAPGMTGPLSNSTLKTVEQCGKHGTSEADTSSYQAGVSNAVPSFQPTSRCKKRGLVISGAPPAKNPRLETEVSGDGPEVEGGARTAAPHQLLDGAQPLEISERCTDPPSLESPTTPPSVTDNTAVTDANTCAEGSSTLATDTREMSNWQPTSGSEGSDAVTVHNIAAGVSAEVSLSVTPGAVPECPDGVPPRADQPGKAKALGLRRGGGRTRYWNRTGDESSLRVINSAAADEGQPRVHYGTMSQTADCSSSSGTSKLPLRPTASPPQQDPDPEREPGSESEPQVQAQGSTELVLEDCSTAEVSRGPPPTSTMTEHAAPFVGFQMASGKAVQISRHALRKARQLLEETEAGQHWEGGSPHAGPMPAAPSAGTASRTPGFTTPRMTENLSHSGTPFQFKAPSMRTPSAVVADIPASAFKAPSSTPAPTTSTSRPVTVPRRVLSVQRRPGRPFKAPRLASRVSRTEEQHAIAKILGSFRAAGATTDCQQVRPVLAGSERPVLAGSERPAIESGFSTAGGRRLSVSAQALRRAQLMMAEDKENGIAGDVPAPTGRDHKENGIAGDVPAPTGGDHRQCADWAPQPSDSDKLLSGFKTASGKGLRVSASALQRAERALACVNTDTAQDSLQPINIPAAAPVSVGTGFQTASGKSLSVSSSSLARARAIVASVPVEDSQLPSELEAADKALLTGFQTAGGRGIAVAHKSFESALRLAEEGEGRTVELPPASTENQILGGRNGASDTENQILGGRNGASDIGESTDHTVEGDVPTIPPVNELHHSQEGVDFDDVDIDTMGAFTQIDFHSRARAGELVCDRGVSESSPGEEAGGLPPGETDSGCYFSTQVVRQLLEFSSGEESDEEAGSRLMPLEARETSGCLHHHGNQETPPSVEDLVSSPPPSGQPLRTGVFQSQENLEREAGDAVECHTCPSHSAPPQGTKLPDHSEVIQHLQTTLSPSAEERSVACAHSVVQTHNCPVPGTVSPTALQQDLSPTERASEQHGTSLLGEELSESVVGALDVSTAGVGDEAGTGAITNPGATPGDAGQTTVTVTVPHAAAAVGSRVQEDSSLETARLPRDQEQPPAAGPEQTQGSHTGSFPGLQTASGKEVHISQQALAAVRQTQGSHTGSFPGLQTASGKEVHISQQALAAVRQTQGSHTGSFPGLQTASGKEVHISQQALAAVRQTQGSHTGSFPGLQTASGKEVHISQQALAAVRQTQGSHTGSFPSLQTASGKEVHISQQALAAVRQTQGSHTGSFPGLQTASGKTVAVTQESLNHVRKSLEVKEVSTDCETLQPGRAIAGLQTASGKTVEISEASLRAVRSLVQEGTDTGRSHPGFPGLQTASGRKVGVSQSSLQAARRALQLEVRPDLVAESGVSAGSSMVEEGPRAPLLTVGTSGDGTSAPGVGPSLEPNSSVDSAPQKVPAYPRLSPATPTAAGTAATPRAPPRYKPTFSVSRAQPTSATPTSAMPTSATPTSATPTSAMPTSAMPTSAMPTSAMPTSATPTSAGSLPAERYKPKFKPGSAKRRSVATTSSFPSAPPPGPQQPTPARGVTTTPEGVMLDRAPPPGRRALVPVQTFLDQDGVYLAATPTFRYPHNVGRTPSTTPRFPASSSFQSSHTSASRPFRSVAIFGSHSAQTLQSRATEHTCRVASTVAGSTGQSGLSRSYPTPRRPVPPRPGCAPVWKASVGRSSQSRDTREQQVKKAAVAGHTAAAVGSRSTPAFHLTRSPLELAQEEGTSLSPAGDSTSTQLAGDSTSTQLASDSTSTQLASDSTSTQLAGDSTSTQLAGSVAAAAIPLSPINITLSQVCALEDSQALELDQPSLGSGLMAATVEDSGYQSKNQSEVGALRSPGLAAARAQSGAPIPERVMESGLASPDFSAFTETANESLNDSLEERNCDSAEHRRETRNTETESGSRSHQIQATPPSRPHALWTSGHIHRTEAAPQPRDPSTSCVGRTTKSSSPVRPQLGSLLAARLQCSRSQRTSLKEAVGGRVPGRYSPEELHSLGVHPSVVGVSVANAESFTFSGPHYFSPAVLRGAAVCVGDGVMLQLREGCAGVEEFWQAFVLSPGVERRLISREWFSNHWRWLVWKLAAMEVAFPREFAGRCLTPDWLALQLKSRYDREADRAERPTLRRICEHDDVPSRTMVLCVSRTNSSRLLAEDSIAEQSATSCEGANESRDASESRVAPSEGVGLSCVELSDGWYSLPAILDRPLRYMLKAGKITVGSKVITYGAELVGSTGPCHPLEAPASLALKLSANSTRRARWFAPLGYQRLPRPFPVPLESIFADGGLVGCVGVVVSRVYPLLFLEKAKEGRSVLRSARAEERVARVHRAERQRKMEAICSRVEAEFQEEGDRQEHRQTTCRRSRRLNTLQIKQLQDGEEIHNALRAAPDPTAFQELLSRTQQVMLESYLQSLRDRQQRQLQSRVRQAMEEAEDSLPPPRNVVPLLRAKLVPIGAHRRPLDCQLSVWGRASEGVKAVLLEGKALSLFNVMASPNRKGFHGQQRLQLTATQATRYEPLPLSDGQLASYTPRQCVRISDLPSVQPVHGEVDTVGVVISLTSSSVPSGESSVRQLDTAYLAGSERQLLAVRLWGGLKAHALDDIITPGAVLAVANLSYRGHTHRLPMATAGDGCSFSQNPKEPHLRQALEELRSSLPRCRRDFLRELEDEIASSYL